MVLSLGVESGLHELYIAICSDFGIRTFFKNSEFIVLVIVLFISFKLWIVMVCVYPLGLLMAFIKKIKSSRAHVFLTYICNSKK